MRVFAPRRCARVYENRNAHRSAVIPLYGEWIDVPDYFVQLTSNREINDVIHAKMVDATSISFTTHSGSFVKGGRLDFEQCWFDSQPRSGYFACSYANFEAFKTTVEIGPSPNYKGKNRRTSRREQTVRRLKPFAMFGRLYTSRNYNREEIPFTCYVINFDINIAIPVSLPAESDSSLRYKVFRITNSWVPAPYRPEVAFPYGGADVLSSFPDGIATYRRSGGYYTRDELLPKIGIVEKWVHDHYDALSATESSATYTARLSNCYYADFPEYNPESGFVLDENIVFGQRVDPMLLGKGGNLRSYWRNYLTQHALLSACESLPRLSDNSIQNLAEIAGFVKSIVVDRKIEIPNSLADAWLAYRYQYGTGKADLEDAIKFVHRRMDLGSLDREIVGYGVATHRVNDVIVTCRCSIKVKPKNVHLLHKIWRALDTYGLTPDFYVVWDSIPYSFMVDWFLPLGDMLGVEDVNSMYFSGEFYDLYDVCYSLSYTRDMGLYKIHCYTRWAGVVPSSLNSLYWFDAPSASNKTVGKRILDAASIFIGR